MFKKLKKKLNWCVLGIGLLSFELMIGQFLFRQGLWYDEIFIADNLVQKNFLELLKPLSGDQVAPIMFLWVEKFLLVFANIVDEKLSDYFLRLYPLLCGFGVILLYYKLFLKLTGSKSLSLLAYALLVLNPIFIYFTSEIKQYICELFYAILLIYVWAKNSTTDWNTKKNSLFLLIVLLSIFNSSTICFVLFPIAVYDGWKIFVKNNWKIEKIIKDKQLAFYIIRYLFSLIFLITYYFCFLYNHPAAQVMYDFWENFFVTTENVLPLLNLAFGWLCVGQVNLLFCIIGLFTLLKLKDKRAFILPFFIYLIHVIFSYFQLYPIYPRLVFYWFSVLPICIASLVICTASLISYICHKFFKCTSFYKMPLLILFVLCVILCLKNDIIPIYLYDRYPKVPLAFIEENYTAGDIIIPQRLNLPHEYISQYYINSIPEDSFFNITDIEWESFLKKTIEHIASLKDFKRAWIISNIEYPIAIFWKLTNDSFFNQLPIKLSFCRVFNKQTVCLFQREEPIEILTP